MAGPIRFRRSTERWDESRVHHQLVSSLDDRFGATVHEPRIDPPPGFTARRFEMGNGDLALFAWREGGQGDGGGGEGGDASGGGGGSGSGSGAGNGNSDDDAGAYWLGNTETPSVLWRTDKRTFDDAPFPMARWAQRELLADLAREAPWLAEYRYLAWFFLPVLFSKDGRETTRAFFRDDAAGFPDATREEGLAFYDRFLRTGILEDYRYTMASKLGTSERHEFGRMRATMGEFDAAKLLADAGHEFVPEVERDSGHALDFLVGDLLVEVTRPSRPPNRRAATPVSALRETVSSKTRDQLAIHGEALLLVDCTSFRDDEWHAVRGERPDLPYDPVVVFRYRPDGHCEGYRYGDVPLDFGDAIEWV